MLNYLKVELVRNFKRLYFWIVTLGSLLLGVVACLAIIYCNYKYNKRVDLSPIIVAGLHLIGIASLLMLVFADMVTNEENKNNTLKNIVSSGFSRSKIYLSKVIASIILMLSSIAIIFFGTIGIGYLLLGIENNKEFYSLFQTFSIRVGIALFLWMGAVAIATFLGMFINKPTAFSFLYVGLFLGIGTLFKYLGAYVTPIFTTMRSYLISTQTGRLINESVMSTGQLMEIVLIGIGYTVVFTIVGMLLMQKKNV